MESWKISFQGKTSKKMIVFSKGWSVCNDGAGQRLVYYLKGCNMRCRWCANPESLNPKKQILFYRARSKTEIAYACPFDAIKGRKLNRKKCADCKSFECIEKWKCPCFELAGIEISPEEILEEAIASKDMFGKEGGITFGGGEPTLQHEELLKTLKLLRKNGIKTTVETNASTEFFKKIMDAVDLLICDFKSFGETRHKRMTGISNKKILKNLSSAIKNKDELWIRIPLVPGLNDSEKEMTNMASFIHRAVKKRSAPLKIEILRMHHIGEPKYEALDMKYPMKNVKEPMYKLAEDFFRKLKNDKIMPAIGG